MLEPIEVLDLALLPPLARRRAPTAGLSRTTIARRAAAARTFTAWAKRTGLLTTDPAARLGSPLARTRACRRCRRSSRPPTC